MRNDGILPALACLKIVIRETSRILASSFAVRAHPIRSILSARDSVKSLELCGGEVRILAVGLVPDVSNASIISCPFLDAANRLPTDRGPVSDETILYLGNSASLSRLPAPPSPSVATKAAHTAKD
jgi:hypothetical protein